MNEANPKIEPSIPNGKTITKSKPVTANRAPISKLSVIAIALTVCLGGFLYYHEYRQTNSQQRTIASLQAEIANLKQTTKQSIVEDLQTNITDTVNQQNQQFSSLEQRIDKQLTEQQKVQQQLTDQVNDSIKLSQQGLAHLNERLSAMSSTDSSIWQISQANYLVHLAGRKIWNDQDYTTARLLLKSADESLAQTNDPSLLPARQAINKDIASLGQVSFIDSDGIIMMLLSLSDALTELPLVSNYKEVDLGMTQYQEAEPDNHKTDATTAAPTGPQTDAATPAAENSHDNDQSDPNNRNDTNHVASDENRTLTSSVSNWSSNLLKSAQSFAEKFIHIEKVNQNDGFTQCLTQAGQDEKKILRCQILKTPLTLEQSMYLRENIRFRLLIAAQAVPRHQDLIYQRALNDVMIWVTAYFDGDAASVKAFLNDIDNLQHQTISTQYAPDKLASSSELEKLMQTRVRSLWAK
ncbi:uroporphyrinogen-III C-methyltransferase [Orbaceae bacterium ESL0727]|nr:uroporphyrinogen-III C-methyltransferase [Orbaceae bacterium ESL0727]